MHSMTTFPYGLISKSCYCCIEAHSFQLPQAWQIRSREEQSKGLKIRFHFKSPAGYQWKTLSCQLTERDMIFSVDLGLPEIRPGKMRTRCGGNIVSYNVAHPWQNVATLLHTAQTWNVSEDLIFRNIFWSPPQMLHAWQNIWETQSCQQCCCHSVACFASRSNNWQPCSHAFRVN